MNPQRFARIQEMLALRQRLTVCMSRCISHNVSAVIRTATRGIHEVHAVWPSQRMRTQASASAGSKQLGERGNASLNQRRIPS